MSEEIERAEMVDANKGHPTGMVIGIEPRRISLTSVAKPSAEAPPHSQTPFPVRAIEASSEIVSGAHAEDTSSHAETMNEPEMTNVDKSVRAEEQRPIAVRTATKAADKKKGAVAGTERRRLLHDLEIARAMREHLAVTNPELTMAASLLGAVRCQSYAPKNEAAGKTAIAIDKKSSKADIPPSVADASDSAKQSKTVLSVEELETGDRDRGGGMSKAIVTTRRLTSWC